LDMLLCGMDMIIADNSVLRSGILIKESQVVCLLRLIYNKTHASRAIRQWVTDKVR